jgi:hypothetical protein
LSTLGNTAKEKVQFVWEHNRNRAMPSKGAEEEGHFPQYTRAPSDRTAEEPGVVHVRPRQRRNIRAGEPGHTTDDEHKCTLAFTYDKISMYFHLPLMRAAPALQISGTALKQVCRRLGIRRWPYTRGGLKRMGIDQGIAAQDSFDRLGYDELIDDTDALHRASPIDSSRHQQQQHKELHQRLQHLESQNCPFTYMTPSHAQLFQAGGLNMLQHQCAQGHELSRQDSNTVERASMRTAFSHDLLNHGAQARTAPGNPTSMSLDQAGALLTSTSSTSEMRRPACSTANAFAVANTDVWNSQVAGQHCYLELQPESSPQVGDDRAHHAHRVCNADFSSSRSARIENVTSDYNHYYCDDDLSWLLSFNSELDRAHPQRSSYPACVRTQPSVKAP